MPSQLINNSAVYFICARDFTYAGEQYKMGEKFDQDIAPGRIDQLVRTRWLYPVVDKIEDKPRHWHHHIHLRSEISKKLGLIHREDSDALVGSSLYNRRKQIVIDNPSVDPADTQIEDEPADVGAHLQNEAILNAATEQVLEQENEPEDDDPEQTEPEPISDPEETEDEVEDDEVEEEEVTEEDLYDPNEHLAPDVIEYLNSDISDEERQRVVAAEKAGKNRKGIVNGY